MPLQNLSSTFDPQAKQQLMSWAKHIAVNEAEQRSLVRQTIAAATSDPEALDVDEPTDRALMILMIQLSKDDLGWTPSGSEISALQHWLD